MVASEVAVAERMAVRTRLLRRRLRRRYQRVIWLSLVVATLLTLMKWGGLRRYYFWGDPIPLTEALWYFPLVAATVFVLLMLWPWRFDDYDD
jgi:hypothetical protein